VHRDVKPDKILLSSCGQAKLIDLGLVRWDRPGKQPLTAGVDGFGTSYYMPLEQAMNAHFVDARSDIFALGASLYHLLTGKVPFPGDDHHEVTQKKDAGVFTPPGMINPKIPPVLEAILNRMLARDPRQRYRKAGDLIEAIEEADLTTGLPSYADLGQAVRDPERKERTGEGTRPDLRLRASHMKKSRGADVWVIRYQGRDGSWKVRKATLDQLVTAVRAGRFRGDVLAARRPGQKLRPLVDFPEFHSYFVSHAKASNDAATSGGFCRRILSKLGLRF
jgi:serine/threonine protein kinase